MRGEKTNTGNEERGEWCGEGVGRRGRIRPAGCPKNLPKDIGKVLLYILFFFSFLFFPSSFSFCVGFFFFFSPCIHLHFCVASIEYLQQK